MPEPILDLEAGKYVCPQCGHDGLWQNFTAEGWASAEVSVDVYGNPSVDTFSMDHYTHNLDWNIGDRVQWLGTGGCSECGWEGKIPGDLVLAAPPRLGWDGLPLYHPIPGQLELVAHA